MVTEFGLGGTRLDSPPSSAVNSLLNTAHHPYPQASLQQPNQLLPGAPVGSHCGSDRCGQEGKPLGVPWNSMLPSARVRPCSQAQQRLLEHLIRSAHRYAAQLNSPGGARPKPRADSRAPYRVLSFHESTWGTSTSPTGQEGAPSGRGAGMVLRA